MKHFAAWALACAACGFSSIWSAALAQSPERICEHVESNSNGLEVWMWSERADDPAANLPIEDSGKIPTDNVEDTRRGAAEPVFEGTFSAVHAGGDAWRDWDTAVEETGPAANPSVPSEEKTGRTSQIVSPPQLGSPHLTVKPKDRSKQPAGSFSFTAGFVSLLGFLAGLPFCLTVLAVALFFILRRYGRRYGLILRVELLNTRGPGHGPQPQDHVENSAISEAAGLAYAKDRWGTEECVPTKQQTLLKQVFDDNIELRRQILGREASAA